MSTYTGTRPDPTVRRRYSAVLSDLCGQDATTWAEVHGDLRRSGFSGPAATRLISENWVALDPDPDRSTLAVRPAEPGYLLVPKGVARRACRMLETVSRPLVPSQARPPRPLARLRARLGPA